MAEIIAEIFTDNSTVGVIIGIIISALCSIFKDLFLQRKAATNIYIKNTLYQKKFEIYQWIWERLFLCIITTQELFEDQEIEIKKLEDRYNYYLQRYSSYNYYVERWKPFYDIKCYQKLLKVDRICLCAGQLIQNIIFTNTNLKIQYNKKMIEYSLERRIDVLSIDFKEEQIVIVNKEPIINELNELTKLKEEIADEIREFININEIV